MTARSIHSSRRTLPPGSRPSVASPPPVPGPRRPSRRQTTSSGGALEKLERCGRGASTLRTRFPVTHWAGELGVAFTPGRDELKQPARWPWRRVVGLRHHGKTCFAHLRDQSGQIQLYARADGLGEGYALFTTSTSGLHRRDRRALPDAKGELTVASGASSSSPSRSGHSRRSGTGSRTWRRGTAGATLIS